MRFWKLAGAGALGLCAALSLPNAGARAAGEGARWGARDPVSECPEITAASGPSVDEVAALIRCKREEITATDELWLMEDVKVRVGVARPHEGAAEFMTTPDADTAKAVHSLAGSWTWVACRDPKALAIGGGDPARNCSQSRVEKAQGLCWMTTFGNWRCNMSGPTASPQAGFPPPK